MTVPEERLPMGGEVLTHVDWLLKRFLGLIV